MVGELRVSGDHAGDHGVAADLLSQIRRRREAPCRGHRPRAPKRVVTSSSSRSTPSRTLASASVERAWTFSGTLPFRTCTTLVVTIVLGEEVRGLPRSPEAAQAGRDTAAPAAQGSAGPAPPRRWRGAHAAQRSPSHHRSRTACVLGIERQPGTKLELTRLGCRTQTLNLRPGCLRVHVVDRHRRDAAPVVDARVEEPRELPS